MQHGIAQGTVTPRRLLVLLALTAAVAAIIATASTMVAMAASDRFDDVPDGYAHEDGVEFVADAGVTVGCVADGSEYCPNDPVTRGQMGTFMHRLSGNDPDTAPSVNAATLQGQSPDQLVADLEARVDELETLLAGAERITVDGEDTLRFEDMNVQIVNGDGSTETSNGVGNLIIGYNDDTFVGGTPTRSGSHYLVVGDGHGWTEYGGIVAGRDNTASGAWAGVAGGRLNEASGEAAAVLGGRQNTASGENAVVAGGNINEASGDDAAILGGQGNLAGGVFANVIAGGDDNEVSGGARWSAILGGDAVTVTGDHQTSP